MRQRHSSRPRRLLGRPRGSRVAVLALTWLLGALTLVQAAPPASLRVSQLVAEQPLVAAYLAVRDESGEPVTGLSADQLSATIGAEVATIEVLAPFAETGEGVTTLFLVDVSRSIVGERFEQMRAALQAWVAALGPADWGGLISFGSSVRTVLAPTPDRAALSAAIAALAPTDQQTLLHAGLLRALDLSRQRIEALPPRRAIVVLSDGLDDDPGGPTADEVLARLDEGAAPIYSIGFSAIRDRTQREAGLAALGGFARRSGGLLVDAGSGDPAAALTAMRERIRAVYRAELRCDRCTWDGNCYRVQLVLRGDGLELSDGRDLRLLPAVVSASDRAEGAAPAAVAPGAVEAGAVEAAGGPTTETTDVGPPADGDAGSTVGEPFALAWRGAAAAVGAAAALLLLTALLVRRARRRRAALDTAVAAVREEETLARAGTEVAATVELSPSEPERPRPVPPDGRATRTLELIWMTGSERGRGVSVSLDPAAVLGRAADCTLALPRDDLVSAHHARLRRDGHRVLLEDLGSTNGTYLNGVAIHAPHPVEEGDVIRVGQSELRLLFQPERGAR